MHTRLLRVILSASFWGHGSSETAKKLETRTGLCRRRASACFASGAAMESTPPAKSGGVAPGKVKKPASKKQKEEGKKERASSSLDPPGLSVSDTAVTDGAVRDTVESSGPRDIGLDAASEELQSPEAVSPHPFWSERAKLEVALAKARPQALDSEAARFSSEGEGLERPVDLEEQAQRRKEVRLDEEFLEPPYESPQKELQELPAASGSEVEATPQSMLKPDQREEQEVLSERASPPVQSLSHAFSVEAVHSGPHSSRVGEIMEEQALEIAQLRSLVDHLQGALTQAEEGRSFTSSSNQGHELYQSHLVHPGSSRPGWESVGLDRTDKEELEPVNAPHALSSPRPPVGPVLGVCQAPPPLPPPPTSMQMSVVQSKPFPEVYAVSSRASNDPFKELVLIHGQPHRWVKIGLEPVSIPSRKDPHLLHHLSQRLLQVLHHTIAFKKDGSLQDQRPVNQMGRRSSCLRQIIRT